MSAIGTSAIGTAAINTSAIGTSAIGIFVSLSAPKPQRSLRHSSGHVKNDSPLRASYPAPHCAASSWDRRMRRAHSLQFLR